jgi:hypothetical protein
MSNQSSYKECENYEECKNVALDKLRDAIALFKGERYTGVLYMVGYVIEIGIKAEFLRLANEPVSFDGNKFKDMMKYLAGNMPPKKPVKDWLDEFSFPPKTIKELFICVENLVSFCSSVPVKEKPEFVVITQNRYPKTDQGFHDIGNFLNVLQGWRKILGWEDFEPQKYNIKNWNVNMRYSYGSSETTLEDAKEALETSLDFLKEVLKMESELSEIREQLEQLEPVSEGQESINEYTG